MPTVQLLATSARTPIKKAWFYLKQGDAVTLLRSDGDGHLLKSISADARPDPASFALQFTIDAPTTVELAYSKGGLAIPGPILKTAPTAFTKVDLKPTPANTVPAPVAAVAPTELNTIKAVLILRVDLPPLPVTFEEPRSLQVWPMLASPFTDAYSTSGLPQGLDLHPLGKDFTVKDGSPAPPCPPADRPRDLGVRVGGKVSNHAAHIELYLLNAKGDRLKFRLSSDDGAPAVDVTNVDVHAETQQFQTRLFPDDPAKFFGLVQVVATTKQGNRDGLGDVVAELLGLQLGLCDDGIASPDGDQPGPLVGPGDERHVIDFVRTAVVGPLPIFKNMDAEKQEKLKALARNALMTHVRARRMVCFDMSFRKRPAPRTGEDARTLLKPEMPQWMAELQLLGWSREEGELFLRLRHEHLGPTDRPLRLSADFGFELAWRGPDADLQGKPRQPGQPRNPFAAMGEMFRGSFRMEGGTDDGDEEGEDSNATARFDPSPRISTTIDIDPDAGTLRIEDDGENGLGSGPSDAPDTDPAPVPFPSSTRRPPKTWVGGHERVWGWQEDGAAVPTLVMEWQPAIVVGGADGPREAMRGGNGHLWIDALEISGTGVARPEPSTDRAQEPPEQAPSTPSEGPEIPLLTFPVFRVKGKNPKRSDVLELVRQLVHDCKAAHPHDGAAAMLSDEAWVKLTELLVIHESRGKHFNEGISAKPLVEDSYPRCYGVPSGMPLFGGPAGYGAGQHDPPRSVDDMWDFYEHLRVGVDELLVSDYGRRAYEYLNSHHPISPKRKLDRAVFVRQLVRSYNGGLEFVFESGHWVMRPHYQTYVKEEKTYKDFPMTGKRLRYCNNALGTDVKYDNPADIIPNSDDLKPLVGKDLSGVL